MILFFRLFHRTTRPLTFSLIPGENCHDVCRLASMDHFDSQNDERNCSQSSKAQGWQRICICQSTAREQKTFGGTIRQSIMVFFKIVVGNSYACIFHSSTLLLTRDLDPLQAFVVQF